MDTGILFGAAATVALGGIFPWINGEIVVTGAALALPRGALPALVLVCASAQMAAKAVLYGIIRWMPERMPARAQGLLSRAESYRGRRRFLFVAILSGSAVALPPFYLVTMACGVLRVPFALFAVAGLAGTASRYAALAWLASSIADV